MDEKNIVEEQNIIPEEKPVTPSVLRSIPRCWPAGSVSFSGSLSHRC